MKKNNKLWIVLACIMAGVVTLACSCGALSSLLATPTPLPTSTPVPTNTPIPSPTITPSPTQVLEPMPGLAGIWRDTAEGTTHTIVWDGEYYKVLSSINDERGTYDITYEYWDGSTFTFDYHVPQTDVTVTIQVISVSISSMDLNWSSTNGNSGTDTFTRLP